MKESEQRVLDAARRVFGDRLIEYADPVAWLSERVYVRSGSGSATHRIGGSMAASILGVGYSSPWGVYREYQDGSSAILTQQEADDCARGKEMEKIIFDLHRGRSGFDLYRCSVRVLHSDEPWAAASADGFVLEDGILGGLEIKTSREPWKWGESGEVIEQWESGKSDQIIPARAAAQVYWYLGVTGLPWWDVVVACPSFDAFLDVRTFRVFADQSVQRAMLRKVGAWRERHLLGGEPPPMDSSRDCRDALSERFAELREPLRAAESHERDLVVEYVRVSERIKADEERKALLRNEIVQAIGSGRGLSVDGGKVLLSRPKNRGLTLRVNGVKADA